MRLKEFVSLFTMAHSFTFLSAESCTSTDWFGANCQYRCHCKNILDCDANGDCPNGCAIGWFGPACQYADLSINATIKLNGDVLEDITQMTDGDDTTCTTLTGSNLSLNVTWTFDVHITWLRIVVNNAELQLSSLSIKFAVDDKLQNFKCVNVFVDNATIDIYCNISSPINTLVLNGLALNTICSVYVSKGRNVALKQSTNQTSTQSGYSWYVSSGAVDGNKGTFTHTNESGDVAPTWTLSFQQTFTVTSYTIYNRVEPGTLNRELLDRLKGFILRSFDQTNKIVQNYTDHESLGLEVYNILSTDPWAQVSYVQITATNPSKTLILSLSEVEIYGDIMCQGNNFKFGRDCDKDCNCAVPEEKCFVSTGNCPSGCKSGYYGQGCNKTCEPGYFGIDCRNYCNNCSGQRCDAIDGSCNSCALKGKKLPFCNEDCDPGSYGSDCKSNCSQNCVQIGSICDVIEGKCLKCKIGFYGNNCTKPCSSNCNDSICDASTGNCVSCKPGYYGMTCDKVCSKNCKDSLCEINSGICTSCNTGFYGPNCSTSCSSNCKDSVCDAVTGNCDSCYSGFYGNICNKTCSKNCKDTICEINSGNCTNCNSGFYDSNCSTPCPVNCKDSVCDIRSGICDTCKPGYQGHLCIEECSNSTYGENCKTNCSINCNINSNDTRICNNTDGHCLKGCRKGFEEPYCEKLTSSALPKEDDNNNIIIGAVVGSLCGILVLLLIGGALFYWRRHKKTDKSPGRQDSVDDLIVETDSRDHVTPSSQLENQAENNKVKPQVPRKPQFSIDEKSSEGEGTGYYNTVTLDPQAPSTVISLSNLQSYLLTHSKEYFHEQFNNLPINTEATMSVGLSAENKNKNRYKNICAYDHSRVHLEADSTKNHGDYINASYLKGYKNDEKFIASQGPTKIILNDFIRMIWEQKVDKVVMLTNLIEDGKSKCDHYWPNEGETTFGEIRVRLAATQVFADYTIRRLQFYQGSQPMQPVTQFHFTSWPDKGVPDNPWALVDFEQRVAATATKRPIVVHCSAGVGRTGTFIALRNVMRQAEDTQQMDFFNTVAKLRQDRTMMIQTAEQYVFLHEAAKVAMTCINTTITSNNIANTVQRLEKKSISGKTEMEIEFESVCSVCMGDAQSTDEEGSAGIMYENSRTVSNKLKNRLSNILPKESYRPALMCETGDMGDYINAVMVPSFRRRNQDFITQLPLPTTVTDFWRLVTQMKVSLVVAFEEHLKNTDQTIADYLPDGNGDKVSFPPFQVTMVTCHQGSDCWEERKLTVTGSTDAFEHSLTHVRYTQNTADPKTLLTFIKQARTYNPKQDGRILYMCRTGATFSGLACVLTLLLDRMDNDQRLTVPLVVGAIKTIRPQVIPTVEQYKILYQVLQRYNETNSVYFNFNDTMLTVLPPDGGKDNKRNEEKEGTEYANTDF